MRSREARDLRRSLRRREVAAALRHALEEFVALAQAADADVLVLQHRLDDAEDRFGAQVSQITPRQLSRLAESAFQDSLHRKVFIQVRPVQTSAVANQLDVREWFWCGVAQAAVLGGGKADFTLVRMRQADVPAFDPNARGFGFQFND